MADSKRLFSIVIPMYNERQNALACVKAFSRHIDQMDKSSKLIVVDDGSRDGTTDILKEIKSNYANLDVMHHVVNQGYGAALKTGIRRSAELASEYTVFADSDLTNHPKYLNDFAQEMQKGTDVIKATRYNTILGGGVKGVPWYKFMISSLGNKLAAVLFDLPLTDCTNGFRAIRTQLLSKAPYTEKGFSIIMEELYYLKQLALTYSEVAYILTSRHEGQSVSSHSYGPLMCLEYLKYPVKSFIGRTFKKKA